MYNKVLGEAIRTRLNCPDKVSRQMVEIFLEELRRQLLRGDKIVLPTIGTFEVYRKAEKGRAKNTARVKFTISRKLLEDLTEKYGRFQHFDKDTERYRIRNKYYKMIYED